MRMNSVRSGYVKSKWYSGNKLEADHDNVFSSIDEAKHAEKRSRMALGVGPHTYDHKNWLIEVFSTVAKKFPTLKLKLMPMFSILLA
jgi:hypothetical protein